MRVGKTAIRRRGDRFGWASFVRGRSGGRMARMARRLVFDGGERQLDQCSALILRRDWRRAMATGGEPGAGEAEATPGGDLKMGPGAAATCDWSLCRLAEAFVFPRLHGCPASVRRESVPVLGAARRRMRQHTSAGDLFSRPRPLLAVVFPCTSQPLVHPR